MLNPGQRYLIKLSDGMLVITPSTDPNYPGVWIDYTREEWGTDQTIALIEENLNGTSKNDHIDVRFWKNSYDDPNPIHIAKEEDWP